MLMRYENRKTATTSTQKSFLFASVKEECENCQTVALKIEKASLIRGCLGVNE